ncbi:MAG TPA: MarR family transcriptional regulator [Candidatus Sulfotelmatobacter sp.]|nr:MarR family transcriptional regulator [Candidatus Sulfotelmatobacter sp.]
MREGSSEPGLIALINQFSKALHRRSSEDLLGMRLKSYLALSYVRDHPGATQQELEAALMVDANAVVILLNELEAARWIVRRRDPDDRRRHLVEITTSGRHAAERAEKAREGLEEEILAGLTQAERATLQKLIRRVLDALLQPSTEARA